MAETLRPGRRSLEVGPPAGPSRGAGDGDGDGDRELLIALDGELARLPHPRIALAIWGAEAVAREGWEPDSPIRSRLRRRIKRALWLMNEGTGDPEVVRGERIADNPQAPAHGAGGLASGGVSACGAGLQDAGAGGSCGAVRWCVGADCESVGARSNTGFVNATARLNMVVEMGGDEFDRDDLRFFTGQRRACRIRWGGLANCCRNSGLLVGLANCSAAEQELAEERHDGNTHYLGQRCARRTFFGVCIRRERVWCVFGSKLGRILQEQGRAQLGIGWGSCRGLTVVEIEGIDFERLDLSEFTENLMDGSMEPAVSLPDAGDTGTQMRTRIRDFYQRGG